MTDVITIGVDLAKNVLQVHGVDAEGGVVFRRQLRRGQILPFFQKQRPCLVGIHLVPAGRPDLLRDNPLDPPPASECAEDADRMILSVPARFKRVGKETRLIINGIGPNESEAAPDPSLIKLIVKAHKLHEKLMSQDLSISDIAESQCVHRSYVSRLIRLVFLSPEITEAILDGRQPLGLTTAKLMRVSLPNIRS